MVGRGTFYPGQFMRRDTPRILAEHEREALATELASYVPDNVGGR